jgi:hypothetical protein
MSCTTKGIYPTHYEVQCVQTLLGLHEGWGRQGKRDITILDLLSWSQDPGGMHLHREAEEDWTWRRGPLAPHSDEASILWDFFNAMKALRATKQLSLEEHVVLALTVMQFSDGDIATVVGWRTDRISRALNGRPKRDGRGQVVREPAICADCKNADPSLQRCGHGTVVYVGGITRKVTQAMNGEIGAQAV